MYDDNTSCDDFWISFKDYILSACSLFISKVKLKAFQSPKWFNSIIRHKLHCVHSLRRKAKVSPSYHVKTKLDAAESDLNSLMLSSKLEFNPIYFLIFLSTTTAFFVISVRSTKALLSLNLFSGKTPQHLFL